jgi:hypothetical protein
MKDNIFYRSIIIYFMYIYSLSVSEYIYYVSPILVLYRDLMIFLSLSKAQRPPAATGCLA